MMKRLVSFVGYLMTLSRYYIASNGELTGEKKLKIWMDDFVSLPRHFAGRIDDKYKKPQSGQSVSWRRFEPGTFRIL
jgi:hypothetical protein